MPFKSTAQRAYLAIHHPKVAHEFAKETPKGAQLPRHVPKGQLATMHKKMNERKG